MLLLATAAFADAAALFVHLSRWSSQSLDNFSSQERKMQGQQVKEFAHAD